MNPTPDHVRQAAAWMARLWADDADLTDQQACQAWREASPEHEIAWQYVESFQSHVDNLSAQGASSHLLTRTNLSRRQLLAMGGLALGAVSLTSLRHTSYWQEATADYRSPTGQIRTVVLNDGSQLLLNTRTRLDVDDYDQQQRLHLHEGELLLRQAKRPTSLHTADGILLPLQARLSLRRTDATTRISIYQGTATFRPSANSQINFRLETGETGLFDHTGLLSKQLAQESETAWTQGKLVAERMPVDQFIHELARYRPGLLQAAPELSAMHVTGVFSVTDTDLSLEQLTHILPVRINRLTRYWVRVAQG